MIAGTLTRKQQRFIEAYLEYWDGARAARAAGFSYPDRAAYRLLRMPHVLDYIEARVKESAMGADEVLTRLTQQARLNAASFFTFAWVPVEKAGTVVLGDDGEPLKRYEMTGVDWARVEEYGYLIKKVSYDRQGRVVLEFHDPQKSLELLGRAHKLFVDRSELTAITVEVSADDMAAARAKAKELERTLLGERPDTDG